MNHRSAVLAVAAALMTIGSVWASPPSLESTLTVDRVTTVGGQTVLRPADRIKPGDILEYRITYTNHSGSPLRGLVADLPIPAGTTLIDRSEIPPGAQGSTDGTRFAPLPLTRIVRLADGTEHQEQVPLADYRALRWALGTLDAGGHIQAHARVSVDGPAQPQEP